jgi:uncharacterized protein YdhG (YjbR/CyaY superfamily)
MAPAPPDVDTYLRVLPDDARPIVAAVLDAVRQAVPGAEERIRYGMPAVMLGGPYAIHVAGWKRHVGVYPVAPLPEALEAEVAPYRAAKDAVHFRYADPVPYELITRMAAELARIRGLHSPAEGP